jgi:hypothetical protein
VGERERQGHGKIGTNDSELAGGDGDAGLAPTVDRVNGGGLGRRAHGDAQVDVPQVAGRAGELELLGVSTELGRGVQELGTGGEAAGSAVVVGRIPVARPTKRTASMASATSASRNQICSRRSFPRARIHAAKRPRVSGSSTMTVSVKLGFPAKKSWPPDLGAVMAAAAISLAT